MDKLSSHITPPSEGTTLQKNTLAPKVNQKFFDVGLGKEQQWDGTVWKDVVATPTYTPPPAAGPVGGTVSATHWRMVVTKTTAFSRYVWVQSDVLWTDSARTVPVPGPVVVNVLAPNTMLGQFTRTYAAYIGVAAPYVTKKIIQVQDVNKASVVTLPLTIEFTYTTPVAPLSIYARGLNLYGQSSTSEPTAYTVESSTDGGLSWVVQHSVLNVPNVNSAPSTVISTNTYPANPVDGQRFLNTTTGINMHWAAADSKWLPDPKFNKWITLSAASVVSMDNPNMLVDTTAAALTITLPTVPRYGDSVTFADAKGTWGTNACTVVPSPGNTLMGGTVSIGLTTTSTIVWNGTDWRIV